MLQYLAIIALVVAQPAEDKIETLPMNITFSTDTYSGYLNVTDTKKLHYVYTESMSDPTNDPLIIWFNGGPGCSSLGGFFQENGPWVVDDDNNATGTIYENPYPWNMRANVMWMESPAGVGFSRADNDDDWKHNDYSQGVDAMKAVESFFEKFPNLLNNELFVSGESYAGIYAPMMTWQIHQANLQAQVVQNDTTYEAYKLRGFFLGNGCTNWKYDAERSWVDTLYGFDMIPENLYNDIKAAGCNYNHTVDPDEIPGVCGEYYKKTENLTATLNPYDLYKHEYEGDILAKKFYNGQARFSSHHAKKIRDLEETTPNADVIHLTTYLQMNETREALHIPEDIQPWVQCTYDPRWNYTQQEEASEWIYRVLKAQAQSPNGSKIRMMHYSGDTDGVVPTYGTKQWIQGLNWDVLEPNQPWKIKDEVNGDQVQGYITQYDGLDFVTVKGVGHMAPQWNRAGMTGMISNWIHGESILLVDP